MATGRIPINGTAAIQSTIVDAKGDIIAATAADAVSRLAVGANNTVLTADSTAGTGLKWATPASPTSGQVRVDTQQTTTSTSYVALTTAQAVTVTTGTKVLVIVSASITAPYVGSVNNALASFAISGATTRAADDSWAASAFESGAGGSDGFAAFSYASFQTVTAGSNTFTAQFRRTSGGTAEFRYRQLIVIDLGS